MEAHLPVGQILANARQAAELSLADIVAATKIKQAHLEAIEASDNASLPAIPFTAGFIKVYANHLELDSNALVKQFKDEVAAGTVADDAGCARRAIAGNHCAAGRPGAVLSGRRHDPLGVDCRDCGDRSFCPLDHDAGIQTKHRNRYVSAAARC